MRLEIESIISAPDLASETEVVMPVSEISARLSKGIEAAQQGKRLQARRHLLAVTEADSKNESAWLWLASISEYPEELLVFLNNVLDINASNERAIQWRTATLSLLAKTFVQRGIDASNEGNAQFAKQSFYQAVGYDDKNEMGWLWLAAVSETPEEKLSHLDRVLRINPANDSAISAHKSALRVLAVEDLQSAEASADEGDTAAAFEFIQKAIEKDAELEGAWLLKAEITTDYDAKVAAFEHALQLNSNCEKAQTGLRSAHRVAALNLMHDAQTAAFDGRLADAKSILAQVLEKSTDIEEAWLLKSHLADGFGEKIEAFERVLEINPENEAARNGLQSLKALFGSFTPSSVKTNASAPIKMEFVEETVQQEVVEEQAVTEEPEEKFELEAYTEETAVEEPVHEEFDLAAALENDEEPQQEAQPAMADEWEQSLSSVDSYDEPQPESAVVDMQSAEEAEEFAYDEVPLTQNLAEEESASEPESASFAHEPATDKCPYCEFENKLGAVACESCHAMFSLSDLEMLLSNQQAIRDVLISAVSRWENERHARVFNAKELVNLGVAELNLKRFQQGYAYLKEASEQDPNDVLLASQVHSLAIRLGEIQEQEESHAEAPRGRTILVVDDSPTVRKLIAGKLEKSGHDVITAVDGVDALAKINEVVPDLILLDITMPRMDGYQVCKLIRNNSATKDVPVVMISGKDGFFDKVRGRMAGTSGYITKPFGPETLMKAVETYVGNSHQPE